MKPIKCHFRNIHKEDRVKFEGAHCLLTISIGQESQEDKRLAAAIDLISQSFESCTIALHDTLQRFTIAINQGQGEAESFYDAALSSGDKWLEQNKTAYSEVLGRLKVDFIRWDKWLNDPDFSEKKSMILSELNRDPQYRQLFDESIEMYLSRYAKRLRDPNLFDRKRAAALCFDYLVEECAVLCLWPKTGCQFEIYPGKHNAAMSETRKRFVHAVSPNLVKSLSIAFNYRPDLKPQCFSKSKGSGSEQNEG